MVHDSGVCGWCGEMVVAVVLASDAVVLVVDVLVFELLFVSVASVVVVGNNASASKRRINVGSLVRIESDPSVMKTIPRGREGQSIERIFVRVPVDVVCSSS